MRNIVSTQLSRLLWSTVIVLCLIYLSLSISILKFCYFLSCLPLVLIFLKDGYKSGIISLVIVTFILVSVVDDFLPLVIFLFLEF